MKDDKQLDTQSFLVRGGYKRSQYLETNEPIFINSGFVYDTAEQAAAAFAGETDNYIYSRYANPSVTNLERKLARLEGKEGCIITATGMAAVYSALACWVKPGDRLVFSRQLFYSCYFIAKEILSRFQIEVEFVDGRNLDEWKNALNKPTKAVFFESPSNPMQDIVDIKAVADLAHEKGALVILDNVVATPLYHNTTALGVDIVTYSLTKHVDGQGRVLGGAVLGNEAFIEDHLRPFIRHTGPGISPFNAWALDKSMATLRLRVDAMSKTALEIAMRLEHHKAVKAVSYPGLKSHPQADIIARQMSGHGTMVTFTLKDDTKEAAFKVLNALQMIDISNNFGDARSLAVHPPTTTHSKLSPDEMMAARIAPSTIRLSIGLESSEAIWHDLNQALIA